MPIRGHPLFKEVIIADSVKQGISVRIATISSQNRQNLFHIPRGKDSSACLYCHESPDFWHGIRRSCLHRLAWDTTHSPATSGMVHRHLGHGMRTFCPPFLRYGLPCSTPEPIFPFIRARSTAWSAGVSPASFAAANPVPAAATPSS